jgi:hypothetical protein
VAVKLQRVKNKSTSREGARNKLLEEKYFEVFDQL